MRKICLVAPVPVTIFLFQRDLIRILQDQKWEVTGVFAKDESLGFGGLNYQQILGEMGVKTFNVPMARRISLLKDIWCLFRLWWFFLWHRYDVIHTSNSKAILLVSIAAKLAGHPNHVATVHGRDYENTSGLKRRFRVVLDKIAYWLSAKTIVVSPSMRDAMVNDGIGNQSSLILFGKGSCCGFDSRHYSREAVDAAKISALQREFNLGDQDKVLLNVGRLRRDKGINELVHAFCSLAQAYPDWHLVLVGHEEAVEPLDSSVLEAIKSKPRIHCKEWLSDPRIAYAMADIFVFPTWREGFGNVAMEAASMELPVVVAASIGSTDTLVDGLTGFLFSTRNGADLENKLRQLIENPELCKRMGKAGRKRVIEDFDSKNIIQGHLSLYRNLVSD